MTKAFSEDGRATKYPIARKVAQITIADGQSVGQVNVTLNGRILRMNYDIPALTGSVTTTVEIDDEDGTSLYSKGSIANNQITKDDSMVSAATPHGIVVAETITIKAIAGGVQTGAKTINVIIYLI